MVVNLCILFNYCDFVPETKRKFEDAMEAASKRVSRGKCVDLVVLGLAWKTTEESLKEYFEEFGEVAMAQVGYSWLENFRSDPLISSYLI